MYMQTPAQSRHSTKGQGCTLPLRDIIQRESPAFATTSLLPRITATTAVLPEVGPVKSECGPYINQHSLHEIPSLVHHSQAFTERGHTQVLLWDRSNLMLQHPN